MEKKIIIFDMDGVLFDSISFARDFFIAGHPGMTEEMYNELHCGNYHEEVTKYSHLKKEETDDEKEKRKIIYAEEKCKTQMYEGVKELLNNLHNDGYILAVNTNAFDRNCLPLLENAGIKNLFDFIATAEISKNKVEKFKLIEERFDSTKENTLFVTDALGDIKEADMANIKTIAVTWGVHDRTFFEREKHKNLIKVVDTVKELEGFIRNF